MSHYRTLTESLDALDDAGHLRRVTRPTNKDTELMPLVRCQFQGLPEHERKAWLFENVTDANGAAYDIPVAVATLGPSRDVYRFNLGCETDAELMETWEAALANPIDPEVVSASPVQDTVIRGEALRRTNGIDQFPVPISTPGFDPAPFLTSAFILTRDPETGVTNVGTYRCQVKFHGILGLYSGPTQDISKHWDKARNRDDRLEVALVIGAPPHVGMVSVSKVPSLTDELAVSGGLIDEALEVVECQTVDLTVPVCAEIVVEGELTVETHPEGPFGEYTGYMGDGTESPNLEISCITHREKPIYQAFISQMPPSESSTIRKVGYEQNLLHHLRETNISNVLDVALHHFSGSNRFLVAQLDKSVHEEPSQAMHAVMGYTASVGKFTIAVDEDINPNDLKSVVWALSTRVQPHRDMEIIQQRRAGLDPASAAEKHRRSGEDGSDLRDIPFDPTTVGDSAVLIDATIPWDDYPPISLPTEPYMERAVDIWEELSLPDLELVAPWFGTSFGDWSKTNQRAAEAATQGRYFDGLVKYPADEDGK